jgi:hypothetical protein
MYAADQGFGEGTGGHIGQGPPSPWVPPPIRNRYPYPGDGSEAADPQPPATAATAAHTPRCRNRQVTKN